MKNVIWSALKRFKQFLKAMWSSAKKTVFKIAYIKLQDTNSFQALYHNDKPCAAPPAF